jgi:WD40 repeat protein
MVNVIKSSVTIFCSLTYGNVDQVWDIKQQSATIIWDLKEHKKAVTCFSLFEAGESLLSGSSDKTIRV